MVSTRNYIAITIMMGVILVLFQFTLLFKENTNEYDVNSHIVATGLTKEDAWDATKDLNCDLVVFVGRADGSIAGNVKQWCTYTKRKFQHYRAMTGYLEEQSSLKQPVAIVVEGTMIDYEKELDALITFAEQGVPVIFSNLPEPSVIKEYPKLQELLGIRKVESELVQMEGVKLFSGFLLGGESIYKEDEDADAGRQDMELEIPWYKTSSGTTTYMVGMMSDSVKDEDLPAIIWRCTNKNGPVFAVNGSYMSDLVSLGILQAMMNEIGDYEIYPVVNAQDFIISNYPGLAAENEEVMMELYSRKQNAVFRDIIWPGMIAINEKNHFNLTFMITPQVDYLDLEEPNDEELVMYLKQLNEQKAEAGLSMEYSKTTNLQVKVNRDSIFFRKTGIGYQFCAAAVAAEDVAQLLTMQDKTIMKNINTLTCYYSSLYPLLSYCTDNITLQCSNSNGVSHTFMEDFRLKGIETALGYSSIELDMNNVAWPQTSDDRWENYYRVFAKNVDTYWKPFVDFDMVTLSESDARVRTFLTMDYEVTREEDSLVVDVENTKREVWFLLRVHNKQLESVEGGEFKEIEDGAYLIHAKKPQVILKTKEDSDLYYSYKGIDGR